MILNMRNRFVLSSVPLAALLLAGCAQTGDPAEAEAGGEAADASAPAAGSDPTTTTEEPAASPTHESAGPSPRLAYTFDGGVAVVDAMSLEVVREFGAEGFTRLNPAGDGRHLFLTEGESFRLLDAGAWSEPHGNHDHSYTAEPLLTDLTVDGSHPGHAVPHGGRTALYFDGSGRIDLLDPTALDATASEISVEESVEVAEAHHGVAMLIEDGALLQTVGTEDSRDGAQVTDADGEVIASTDECPGVHGEASAAGGAVVLGCEDGLVIYDDGQFTKVEAPDDYGRIGNQAGSSVSAVVLGDYKVERDAELERPEWVSLTDTGTGELRLVDLGTSYSFRSLARGPQGEGLVLGTDGELHVIDPATGEITAEIPVVEEWEEPMEWQDPRPTIFVQGQFGYVTEPATRELHLLDLDAGEVIDSATLPHVPNELSGISGDREDAHGGGHEDGHDEEGHEHDEEEQTS